MTNEQQQVKEWMTAFGQECPEKPTIPSLAVRKLRAKLELEETLEKLVLGLGITEIVDDYGYVLDLEELLESLKRPDVLFQSSREPNLVEIADGCEDQKVVVEGTLVACGLVTDKFLSEEDEANGCRERDYLFDEVMRSNNSKMWTREEWKALGDKQADYLFSYNIDNEDAKLLVVKDPSGKVIKSPSYSPANLQPIIDEMSK